MVRLLAIVLVPLAIHSPAADPGFAGFAMKLPAPMREQLRDGFWRPGCPVPLSDLRLLTVRHYGWDEVEGHDSQLRRQALHGGDGKPAFAHDVGILKGRTA